jgi:RNA polymerase sigma-70 factor (ECF subfamily)
MFTILHNQHITNYRRQRPVVSSVDDINPSLCQVQPNQDDKLMLQDLDRAFQKLSAGQQKALILVVVHGLSHEDAARVCDCAVGTIKSRIARARSALHIMLLGHQPGSDQEGDSGDFSDAAAARGRDAAKAMLTRLRKTEGRSSEARLF